MKTAFDQAFETVVRQPCTNGMIVPTEIKKPLTPKQVKLLKKSIDDNFQKFMHGIHVNIMNLSKVTDNVFDGITKYNLTMEDAYNTAKKAYREN